MTTHTSLDGLLLSVTALTAGYFALIIKRQFWNLPLNHGRGYFLGVEVSPGFYEGEGAGWLRRYRAACLLYLSVVALALLAVLLSGRWFLLPFWAGGSGAFLGLAFPAFAVYTRRALGANPPVRPSVAIALEARRLGDYISWPAEALIAALTASSWALLLISGNAKVHWYPPVILTYVIAGLFPFKVGIVRTGIPIPTDRPEEHYRWIEAQRRYSLYTLDYQRWFFVVILGGYAVLAGWRTPPAWALWSFMGIALAVWIVLTITLIRRSQRLTSMGHNLRPVGSWSTPFRSAKMMAPNLTLFIAWFGGLVTLIIFSFLRD
jgi:hypothetical protein